jgi:LemA protein
MKKWLIPVIVIGVIGYALYSWAVGFNNTAVKYTENVSESWANVETSYQRRNDLIDNLVNTVKGATDFEKGQGGLSGALKSLLVTVERYPELKANQNFLKLQDELASTENQILTARTRFNEQTKPYNNHVKIFPNSILAAWFNFEGKPYFQSEPGAKNPVKVDFNKK